MNCFLTFSAGALYKTRAGCEWSTVIEWSRYLEMKTNYNVSLLLAAMALGCSPPAEEPKGAAKQSESQLACYLLKPDGTREDIAATKAVLSESETLMVATMTPKTKYSLKESIDIYCAIYFPLDAGGSTVLTLYDGAKPLQKSATTLNFGAMKMFNGPLAPVKRSLGIGKYFTIPASKLGVGVHSLTIKPHGPVPSTCAPIKIQICE